MNSALSGHRLEKHYINAVHLPSHRYFIFFNMRVALKKIILCISTPAGGSGEFISNHSVLLTPLIDRQDKEHLTRCSAAMGEQPGGSECECVFSV